MKHDNFNYTIVSILAIAVVGLIIYFNSLHVPFQYDDFRFIAENNNIKDLHDLSKVFSAFARRKMIALSFALNYHFSGLDVFGYHAVNVAMHILGSILVYVLVILIFRTPKMLKSPLKKKSTHIALIAGFVFLCHPVQTNAVTYIWQRTASQAALFYLISIVLYLWGRLRKMLLYFACFAFTAVCAILSKENAVSIPLMVFACELYFFGLWRNKKRLTLIALAIVFVTAIIVSVYALIAGRGDPQGIDNLFRLPCYGALQRRVYLLTQFDVLKTYLRIMILPCRLNLDYDYPLVRSMFDLSTLGSLALLLCVTGFAVRMFKKSRLLSFSIAWYFITIIPESSIVPINDVIVEYRLYLPIVGFALFLAVTIYRITKTPRPFFVVSICIIFVFCVLTHNRNAIWRSEVTLWKDTVAKSPNKARPRANLGYAYLKTGEYDLAIYQSSIATRLESTYSQSYYNLGLAYSKKGDYAQSIDNYLTFIAIKPFDCRAHNNLGVVYSKINEYEEAMKHYKIALQYNPDHISSHNNLALLYIKMNNIEMARKEISILRGMGQHDKVKALETLLNEE